MTINLSWLRNGWALVSLLSYLLNNFVQGNWGKVQTENPVERFPLWQTWQVEHTVWKRTRKISLGIAGGGYERRNMNGCALIRLYGWLLYSSVSFRRQSVKAGNWKAASNQVQYRYIDIVTLYETWQSMYIPWKIGFVLLTWLSSLWLLTVTLKTLLGFWWNH